MMMAELPAGFRPMSAEDLDRVMEIELRAYPYPWTRGIFEDCLRSGYPGLILERDGQMLGYGMISLAAGEAHVLNVCIDPAQQSSGQGRLLFRALIELARSRAADRVFLEVRPSNQHALALYLSEGFNEIGRRPRYYPADSGREDALVMAMELLPDDIFGQLD